MAESNPKIPTRLAQAVEAIDRLTQQRLTELFSGSQSAGLAAHSEIGVTPVGQKCAVFYRHFLPLVSDLVVAFVDNYRRYFKLALAHPTQTGNQPDQWAWNQLQAPLSAVLDWIPDWFALACDGENRYVRRLGSAAFVPGTTTSFSVPLDISPVLPAEFWRAPAWLFQVGWFVGISQLKEKHVPARDSDDKLSKAYTRLLLKGARRMFLMALAGPIEDVQNEETAADGAIRVVFPENNEKPTRAETSIDSKHRPKGFEGLGPKKADLSGYFQDLTEKQQMAASLKWEYGLGLAEIASRMRIDRKTAYEHIEAAERKIDQFRSTLRRGRNPSKTDE
jgi:DNA-directed RNA polymerase specialized sigma24 family protein